jgi:predicted DNA-binding transcriptional regulator AlpA
MVSTLEVSETTLLTIKEVANIYKCDKRSVARWSRDGRIPPGIKISAAMRWDAKKIYEHIAAGCPAVATT